MTRIAIIHHDLEWSEQTIAAELSGRGYDTTLCDIRQSSADSLCTFDAVLNRVYASVADRDFAALERTVNILESLEDHGVRCINGVRCSRADYDKYLAFQLLSAESVATPLTMLIDTNAVASSASQLRAFGADNGMPFIVKRNSGGRAQGIYKLYDADDLSRVARIIWDESPEYSYNGRWIAQRYVRSSVDFGVRGTIMAGRIACGYKRDLVKITEKDSEPWVSSCSRGSRSTPCDLSADVVEAIIAASAALKADFNAMDIVLSEEGPVIIDNNPTFNFTPEFLAEVAAFVDGVEKILADP